MISKHRTPTPNIQITITFNKTGREMIVDAVADASRDEWDLICCYWPISKRDRKRKVYDETCDLEILIRPEDRRRIIDSKLYTYDPCEVAEKGIEHWKATTEDAYMELRESYRAGYYD